LAFRNIENYFSQNLVGDVKKYLKKNTRFKVEIRKK